MNESQAALVIREAVPADYPALTPIADEVHALHAAAHPRIFQPVGSGSSLPQAWFDDLLAGDMSTILVAEIEHTIVGFVIANVFDTPPFEVLVPRRVVFIDSMAVTAAQRGKGIGRALLEAASAWGRAKGATNLELTVWEFNRSALAFYERLGLTTIHRTMQLDI
jgi:GNAT superfamily N-acetyltransferase